MICPMTFSVRGSFSERGYPCQRTIPSGDFIVIQTEVGNNVVITSDAA